MRNGLICSMLVAIIALCAVRDVQAQQLRNPYALYAVEKPKSSAEMGFTFAGVYLFTSQNNNNQVGLKPRIGVRGALSMSLCWHESYALQMELAYIYNKVEAQYAKAQYDVKTGSMEIPVMFSYRGVYPLRFNAGIAFSVASTGRYDLAYERVEFGGLRPMVGYVGGIGVNLSRNLLLEARYTGGFSRTMNYFEGAEFYTRSGWLTFGIGYMF